MARRCKKSKQIITLILCICLCSPQVFASGLLLYEQGQPGIGTANAGQAAEASDASTSYFNPAGMTQLDRPEILSGAQILILSNQFKPNGNNERAGSTGNDAGAIFPGGGLYYVQPITERLRAGLSMNAPMGLGSDYGDGWKARYLVQNNFLAVVAATPSLALRLTDWLSVGAGVSPLNTRCSSRSRPFSTLLSLMER
jgi:long-chain fatty acid transport protein